MIGIKHATKFRGRSFFPAHLAHCTHLLAFIAQRAQLTEDKAILFVVGSRRWISTRVIAIPGYQNDHAVATTLMAPPEPGPSSCHGAQAQISTRAFVSGRILLIDPLAAMARGELDVPRL